MGKAKITVVGAGNVGASVALYCSQLELGDVVLIDIRGEFAQGKALDIWEAAPIDGTDARLHGGSDYAATANSDIVIITAGLPRKPGMSRDDLVRVNAGIVKDVVQNILTYSKDPYIIVVSNPLDAMVYAAWKVSGLPTHKVMGMAGTLDSTRYRSFIAEALNVSVKDVVAFVMGGHGDTMVPVKRLASVGGIPLTDLISDEQFDKIIHRTRNGGGEFLPLLQTSAWIAPARGSAEMAEAILRDKKRVVPVAAYLNGEYGQKDLFIGVPVVLGAGGVERVLEVKLTADEMGAFDKTVAAVRELVAVTDKVLAGE